MITPNLSPVIRGFYVVVGVALLAGPFALGLTGWTRWVMIVVGVPALVEGLVGW